MVYPSDIYAKTTSNNKASPADKAKVVMFALLVINIGFFVVTSEFFSYFGVPKILLIGLQTFLYLYVCLQIFRFAVYREQDREGDECDIFMPYYKFRSGCEHVSIHKTKFDLFELDNNSFTTVIEFKFGMNNTKRSELTEEFMNQIHDLVHENRLSCRFVVMNESFIESKESHKMLRKANAIEDLQLRATQLNMYNEVLNFAESYGTVPCIYLMLYTPSSFFKDSLEDVMVQINTKYQKISSEIAFRQIKYLDHTDILNMFKKFYGMDAIDLALSQIQFNLTNSEILQSISVFRIISKEGKSFANDVFSGVSAGVKWIK